MNVHVRVTDAQELGRLLEDVGELARLSLRMSLDASMRGITDMVRGDRGASHLGPWRRQVASRTFKTRVEMRRPIYRQPG